MNELVSVEDLHVHFRLPGRRGGVVRAVAGVSFGVMEGETLGLVGESGSGKSTLGRALLRLYPPASGRLRYRGSDITLLDGAPLRALRRKMQMVFQDPYASLNPRLTVGGILGEALDIHGLHRGGAREGRIRELLQMVGLPYDAIHRHPHEFSGGQRQRIGIARALAVEPEFIVCDEPVSALDVSIQAQVINLLQDLQERLGLTYLFIAHDLSVVRHISSRVVVMYLGHVVELAATPALFAEPRHPYTRALLSAVPSLSPNRARKNLPLTGEIPSAIDPPVGCPFHTRCPLVVDRCRTEPPMLRRVGEGHLVACHLVEM